MTMKKRGRGRPAGTGCPIRKAALEAAKAAGEKSFTIPEGGKGCAKCGGMVMQTSRNSCRACAQRASKARLETPEGRAKQCAETRAYQKANPAYALARDVMKRLSNGAKTGLKVSQVFDLVGYTSEELRVHMETLFTEGMSWDNHGAWHIDHIKPVAAFKAEGVTDVAIINALSNLQPLWAVDNMRKGARFD